MSKFNKFQNSKSKFDWEFEFEEQFNLTVWSLTDDLKEREKYGSLLDEIQENYRDIKSLHLYDFIHATLDYLYKYREDNYLKRFNLNNFGSSYFDDLEVMSCSHPGCDNKFFDLYKRCNSLHFCSFECEWSYKRSKQAKNSYQQRTKKKAEIVYLLDLLKEQNNKCNICKKYLFKEWEKNYDVPSVDHKIPISKNGLHTLENLQIVCLSCNLRKNNKVS